MNSEQTNIYLTKIRSELDDAPIHIKESFNNILQYFSYQDNTLMSNAIDRFYSLIPTDLVFKPDEVGYLRWIKKNVLVNEVQYAINIATLIVDIDTPLCLAITLRLYALIINNSFKVLPSNISIPEGSLNKRIITLELFGLVPVVGQLETDKAKEWSLVLDTVASFSIDNLENDLSELYDKSGLIKSIDLEGNTDFNNFKVTKRSKYDIVIKPTRFSLADVARVYPSITPFKTVCKLINTKDSLTYDIPDVPLVTDLPNPSENKIPSNSGLIKLGEYLSSTFSKCQGNIFIKVEPKSGDTNVLAKVIVTLTDDPTLSYITINNESKTKILFK